MWMIRLPWRSRARARQHERTAQRHQDQQRAEAVSRIIAMARDNWNEPTYLLPQVRRARSDRG